MTQTDIALVNKDGERVVQLYAYYQTISCSDVFQCLPHLTETRHDKKWLSNSTKAISYLTWFPMFNRTIFPYCCCIDLVR